jgi:outer membrane murein-binding lipoprotein Lpp
MNKKYIFLCLALILVLPLLGSCSSGISQAQYDKVYSDLSAAQAQTQKLQADLSAAQAQTQKMQADLSAAQSKMKLAKSEIDVINAIFIPAMNGDFANMTQAQTMTLFWGWRDKIIALGDPALTAKFQAIIDSNGDEAKTLAFFILLFESLPKILQ